MKYIEQIHLFQFNWKNLFLVYFVYCAASANRFLNYSNKVFEHTLIFSYCWNIIDNMGYLFVSIKIKISSIYPFAQNFMTQHSKNNDTKKTRRDGRYKELGHRSMLTFFEGYIYTPIFHSNSFSIPRFESQDSKNC